MNESRSEKTRKEKRAGFQRKMEETAERLKQYDKPGIECTGALGAGEFSEDRDEGIEKMKRASTGLGKKNLRTTQRDFPHSP